MRLVRLLLLQVQSSNKRLKPKYDVCPEGADVFILNNGCHSMIAMLVLAQ
jgi:hypothetical protein